jgi:hypothetical protein
MIKPIHEILSVALTLHTCCVYVQVLKLYVAAYQCHHMWKQLWTSIYPVISPQIIRDVEAFIEKTPFAVKPFVEILKTSSPFLTGV